MRLRWLLHIDGHILVLALVAVVFVLQVCALTRKAPNVDVAVMAAAANILDNGVLAEPFVPSSVAGPGRSMTPGYPAFLAAVALLDARMAEGIRCLAMEKAGCFSGNPFRLLLVLQTLVGLIALAFACFLAHELSGSAEIAGLTTLLMFVMGRFAHVAGLLAPNVIVMALVLAFCTLLVLAHRHRSVLACALSGLTLGVLALIEIYYAALTVLVPLLLVAADRWHVRPDRGFAWRAAAAFAVAAGLAFAPWVARNVLLFGDMALTQAVTSKLLAERVAYNNSTAGELLAAGLYWIPGSNFLLSAETKSQFDLYYEETLLLEGARIQAKAQAAGGAGGPTVRLLQAYVLGDPVGYAGASLPLLLRGIGSTGGLLVLWGWLAVPLLLRRLKAQRGQRPFLLVAGPLIGVAIVQALLTPNLPSMNLGLVFVYAYAIAAVTGGLELPIALRRLMARRDGADRASSAPYPARTTPGAWPAAARPATWPSAGARITIRSVAAPAGTRRRPARTRGRRQA